VGYGTVRKDSPFQGLNPAIRRTSGIMRKMEKNAFHRIPEVGSEETTHFSFLMA
jgi:hypothetical protein